MKKLALRPDEIIVPGELVDHINKLYAIKERVDQLVKEDLIPKYMSKGYAFEVN